MFETQSVKQTPTAKRITQASQTVVTGASASEPMLKPVAPSRSPFQLAFARAAWIGAPSSAPPPKNALRIPKTSGPASGVSREDGDDHVEVEADELLAIARTASARRMSALPRVAQALRDRCARTSARIALDLEELVLAHEGASAVSTARKVIELIRSRRRCRRMMITPAIAGPMMRAPLKRPVLSATAFGSSSRPTIWNVSDCRPGASRTSALPPRNAST